MASQTDWDQGGTTRQLTRLYLGPSVGWVLSPGNNILPVTTGGTTTIVLGTTLVLVNVASPVTIILPAASASEAGAQALPGTFLGRPITIVDVGGNAASDNITIKPGDGTIDGLSSVAIKNAYGAIVATPNTPNAGYTLTQS